MLELRQLRAFVTVAEELSVARAAERLLVGQHDVSRMVARLERELGVALLDRTTREVRLTTAGLVLLIDGRDAVASIDAAFENALSVGGDQEGAEREGVSTV
jgi:DNA-binding transcriptional LysR family regulator